MRPDPVIAIGGENLIDSVQSTSPAGDVLCTDNLGGSPYNVAVALARQDVAAHYLTPISTDPFGQRLADHLTREGVIVAAPSSTAPTTRAIVSIENGMPHYRFQRDNTAERAVTTDLMDKVMPKTASHLHVGSLAFAGGADAEVWETAFHAAAQQGLTTSLDPNVRPSLVDDPDEFRARFRRLLSSATVVKLSDEDIGWIYPDLSIDHAMTRLREESQAALIALTKGPDGAELWTANGHVAQPNPKLDALVDTIGAGDTFMATLLAQLAARKQLSHGVIAGLEPAALSGLLKRCLHAACLNCAQSGCNPPTTAAIDGALAKETT